MDIGKIIRKMLEIDDLVSKKHTHANKSILDAITQALIDSWNSAYTHISDAVKHITSEERNNWNDANSKKHTHSNKTILDIISQTNLNNWDDKYTKNEIDNKFNVLTTNLDWKESVATFSAIATTYPTPDDGWTVNVKDTDITYRFDGATWIPISANSIPLATSSVDGKMSKQDKIDHDDMNGKKHTHANKTVIDTITQTLIDTWNSAYSHISDVVKHITSEERTLWNTVSNKVDKITGKSLSTNDFDNNYKSKVDGISSNANKVEASTTNGNIKIDSVEKIVYTHPSGTNPHGTTKSDIGLGNVTNDSQVKRSEMGVANGVATLDSSGVNNQAPKAHTHDDRYYTETEADTKFATKSEISNAGYGNMLKSVYDTNGDGVVDSADKLDGKHASDFAPSGYGLGENMQGKAITDANTALVTGFYYCTGASNCPSGAGDGNLMVLSYSNLHIHQMFFEFNNADNGRIFMRKMINGTWKSWYQVARIGDMPTSLPANGGNANTIGGYGVGGVGVASSVVVRDGSGYIQNTWFNSNRGSENTAAAQYLYDTGDGYMRKKDLANVRAEIVTNGFGLGGTNINIANQDLNNYKATGFYMGSGMTNAPNSGWFWVIVQGHNNAWVSQMAISFGSGNTANITYTRTMTSGTWTDWKTVLTNKQGLTWNDLKGV